MNATAQVEYESRVRIKFGVVAFLAALFLVASQLFELAGPHSSVTELTLELIVDSQRKTLDIVGAVCDLIGLLALGFLLNWLFDISRARNPGMRRVTRWLSSVGCAMAAVMAVADTVVLVGKANTFVTTGTQSYPQAYTLTSGGLVILLQLLLQLGILLLTLGCIWTSLNAMRVGLLPRMIGYVGVIAGALFLFPIPVIVPVIQGFWLAAVAVTLWARWPSGDPPAWAAGESIPWAPVNSAAAQRQQAAQTRRQRRRVSTQEVLAAVETKEPREGAPSPSTSASKRKRKRK